MAPSSIVWLLGWHKPTLIVFATMTSAFVYHCQRKWCWHFSALCVLRQPIWMLMDQVQALQWFHYHHPVSKAIEVH